MADFFNDPGMMGGVAKGLMAGLNTYQKVQALNTEREKQKAALEVQKANQFLQHKKLAPELEQQGYELEYGPGGLIKSAEKGERWEEIQKQNAALRDLPIIKMIADLKESDWGRTMDDREFGLKERELSIDEDKQRLEWRKQGFSEKEIDAKIDKLRADAAKARADAAKTRKGSKPRNYSVPGLTHDGSTPIDDVEFRKIKSAYTDGVTLKNQLSRLENELRNMSRIDLLNPSKVANVQQLLKTAQLQYKGDAFAKLGVLAGPDMDIINSVIMDPMSGKGVYMGPDGVADLVSRMRKDTLGDLTSKIKTYGFRPDFGGGLIKEKRSGAPKQQKRQFKSSEIEWAD